MLRAFAIPTKCIDELNFENSFGDGIAIIFFSETFFRASTFQTQLK
jgi:hypothetical protein